MSVSTIPTARREPPTSPPPAAAAPRPSSRSLRNLGTAILLCLLMLAATAAVLLQTPWSLEEVFTFWQRFVSSSYGAAFLFVIAVAIILVLHRRIQQAQAAVARSQRIIESTFDAIVATDQAGRISMVNAEVERLFGYKRSELLGQPFELILPGDTWRRKVSQAAQLAALAEARNGRAGDMIGRNKDGQLLPLEVTLHAESPGQGAALTAVIRDASERKRAEASLNEQDARLKLLMDQMPAILWTTDTKLQITSTLGKGLAELNLRPREVIGMSLLEHLKKDNLDCTPIAAHLQALRGEALSYEMEWLDKHFQVRVEPLRNPARLITGTIGVVVDVTARKQAELALQRKQEEITEFFQTVAIGLHWVDPEGRILWANHAVLALLGHNEAEYVGRSLRELHADLGVYEDLQRRLNQGERLRGYEVRMQTRDGGVRHVLLDTIPYEENGKLVHTRCFLRDLTDHKRLEDQLRQSSKMEAVGRLAGGIAHDFNNLLTIINGYGDMLNDTLEPQHAGRELVEEIRKAGDRAARLTRQLLTFSRHQVLMPAVLNLNELVTDMQQLLRRLLGEHIELATDLEGGLRCVKTDPGQMEQVLMNLAVNARDAMAQGGRLTLRTRNVDLDGQLTRQRPELPPGRYVLLQVIDTGHGMDEATLARIFEPFFTTKEMGKGTGLGLATVYGIIKQSSGSITAESGVGRGTSFSIFLPETLGTPGKSTQSKPAPRPVGSETILLVEDEESLRALATQVLKQQGYTVLSARDGTEALALAERYDGPIALVATDVVMPRMSGRELTEALAATRPGLKVLYLSGYMDDDILGAGVADASVPFLPKPFSPDTLARKVRAVLDG